MYALADVLDGAATGFTAFLIILAAPVLVPALAIRLYYRNR